MTKMIEKRHGMIIMMKERFCREVDYNEISVEIEVNLLRDAKLLWAGNFASDALISRRANLFGKLGHVRTEHRGTVESFYLKTTLEQISRCDEENAKSQKQVKHCKDCCC